MQDYRVCSNSTPLLNIPTPQVLWLGVLACSHPQFMWAEGSPSGKLQCWLALQNFKLATALRVKRKFPFNAEGRFSSMTLQAEIKPLVSLFDLLQNSKGKFKYFSFKSELEVFSLLSNNSFQFNSIIVFSTTYKANIILFLKFIIKRSL